MMSNGGRVFTISIVATVVVLIGAAVLAGIDGARQAHGLTPVAAVAGGWPWIALLVGALGAGLWIGALWMRAIDEAAREAHKWAWYWGGSTGMYVGFVALFSLLTPAAAGWSPPNLFPYAQTSAAMMASGAFLMTVFMLVGYGVAWAVWWWRRR